MTATMRDDGCPTSLRLDDGTPIYLADTPCTACGCYQAYTFECNCGSVHSDVCYNCGGFVDMKHDPIEVQNEGMDRPWSGRCLADRAEHTHTHPYETLRRRRLG